MLSVFYRTDVPISQLKRQATLTMFTDNFIAIHLSIYYSAITEVKRDLVKGRDTSSFCFSPTPVTLLYALSARTFFAVLPEEITKNKSGESIKSNEFLIKKEK
jgi:hypothetical protein